MPAQAPSAKSSNSSQRATFGKQSSSSWVKNSVDTSFLAAHTFGRPNRPSTPIYGVITNEYGREWEEKQAKAKAKKDAAAAKNVTIKIKPQPTKASLGHVKSSDTEDKPRFVMQRFAGTDKKVVTHWDHKPRRRGEAESDGEAVAAAEESKHQDEYSS